MRKSVPVGAVALAIVVLIYLHNKKVNAAAEAALKQGRVSPFADEGS